jgi:raffinose/stachyose/melibiose transport system permease protein
MTRLSTTAEHADLRASASPRRRDGSRDSFGAAFVLMLPAIALYALFSLTPILLTVWISFTNSGGFNTEANFVGLDNYLRAGDDPIVWQSLGRTSCGSSTTWCWRAGLGSRWRWQSAG